jgi:biotin carboxyl carrier protein
MKRIVEVNGRRAEISWTNSERVSFRYESGGYIREGEVSLVAVEAGVYSILWDGRSYEARVAGRDVIVGSRRFDVVVRDPREYVSGEGTGDVHGHCEVTAPMPGKVIRVLVAEREAVAVGQGIVVVEAMKMQNEMRAARAGTIASIRVKAGDAVAAGQVLAVIDE